MTPIAFDRIEPKGLVEALRGQIAEAERALADVLAAPPADAALLRAVDGLMRDVDRTTMIAEHLDEMLGTAAWRDAYAWAAAARDELRSVLAGSTALYALLRTIDAAALDAPAACLLETQLRQLRKGGAQLPAGARERLAEADRQLVAKTLRFTRNVDDAVRHFSVVVPDEAGVRGLPSWCLELTRVPGGFRLTLEPPVLFAVLRFAEDRELRRTLYLAQSTCATDGENDNRLVLQSILTLRGERAALLGYLDFADSVLDGRMKRTGREALGFLEELSRALRAPFDAETRALETLAAARGCAPLQPWDVAYLAELAKREHCQLDAESLRPYLPFSKVLQEAQDLTTRWYGTRWAPALAPTWHPAVSVWHVWRGEELLSTVYIDPFAREGKRQGAWMTPLAPCGPGLGPGIAVLAVDIAAPLGREPELNLEEVGRLFHELGHIMHHVLSRSRYRTLSGTNVAADFVEFPSTFFEKLVWERSALLRLVQPANGEPAPVALVDRCLAARNFRAASGLVQRVGLAVVDLTLHSAGAPPDALAAAAAIMQAHAPAPLPAGYVRLASVTHVFGSTSGYEASLYSYIWAEVLACDARSASGRALDEAILAAGGEIDPAVLLTTIFGRPPSARSLLAECGATFQESP